MLDQVLNNDEGRLLSHWQRQYIVRFATATQNETRILREMLVGDSLAYRVQYSTRIGPFFVHTSPSELSYGRISCPIELSAKLLYRSNTVLRGQYNAISLAQHDVQYSIIVMLQKCNNVSQRGSLFFSRPEWHHPLVRPLAMS